MNLLLLEPGELGEDGKASLADRRAEHLLGVLGVEPGRELRCGVLGGGTGRATVTAIAEGKVEIDVALTEPPPEPPWLELVVALPRPQVLHRVLQFSASMGVGRIDFVNAWRVEKSFFSSPSLNPETIRRHLLLGAEQGLVPRLPEVALHPRLLPFLDALVEVEARPRCLIAHPEAPPIETRSPIGTSDRLRIAIGPEGGWIDREVESFIRVGFEPVSLGPWVLRVEAALVAVAAQAELLRRMRATRVG